MDYTPKHAQPFTYTEARELEIPTIAKEISRLENSLAHLNRTQAELNEHLSGSAEEDCELLEVIRENEGVISSQNERITMLKMALEEQGIDLKSGHYYSGTLSGRDEAARQTPVGNPTDSENSNPQTSGQAQSEETDNGVYL